MKKVNLSKSKFIAGLQCLKRLHLMCYQPRLARKPDEKQRAIFAQGHEVGELAQERFPGGVLVEESNLQHQKAVSSTLELISDRKVPAIFEAAFTFGNIRVRADVLERLPQNRWRMIEVKSTTGVKDQHHPDVAVQKYVLEGCGLEVPVASLMHLNREYVYDGNQLRLDSLFTITDLAEEIIPVSRELPGLLSVQWKALALEEAPYVEPGKHCAKPYLCEFFNVCNREPADDWVGHLPGIRAAAVEKLAALGIGSIHDIPDDFGLSNKQRIACRSVKQNKPYFGEEIRGELDQLEYPLYFMDFETCNPAIPRYAGMRTFDQIPFQWSVHVLKSPQDKLEHYEFLAVDKKDPREEFLTTLLEVLEGEGNIIVYNQSFEATRLKELARWFPGQADRIEQAQERMWDLLELIRNHVYHPDFKGSFSIKNVLPALVPEMTYDGMKVSEGAEAGLAYEKMISGNPSKKQKAWLRKSLLDYCRQDTLAMAELLKTLK